MITDLYGRQLDAIVKSSEMAALMLAEVRDRVAYQAEAQETRDAKYDEIVGILRSIDSKMDQETATLSAQTTATIAASPAATTNTRRPSQANRLMAAFSPILLLKHVRRIDRNVNTITNFLLGGRRHIIPGAHTGTVAMAATGTTPIVTRPTGRGASVVTTAGAAATAAGATGGGGGGFGGIPPTTGHHGGGHAGGMSAALLATQANLMWLSHLADGLIKGIGIDLMSVFDGVLKDSFQFVTNIRMASFETRDWGQDTQQVAKDWIDFGLQARETGYDRTKFEEIYQKQVQQGLTEERKSIMRNGKLETTLQRRSIKDQQNMIKTSMNTAFMIGASVDETSEMFSEWQRHLALSNAELNQMSDSMKNIARTTGVSGQHLLDAAKSSQNIFKELRRMGALTTESMANVTQMMALFHKSGMGEFGEELLGALSSWENFLKADPRMSSLIFRSAATGGVQDKLYAGNMLQSRDSLGKFFSGFEKNTLAYLKGVAPDLNSLGDVPRLLEQLDLGLADAKYGDARQQGVKAGQIRQFLTSMGIEPGKLNAMLKMMAENQAPTEKLQALTKDRDRMLAEGKDVTFINERIKETKTAVDTEKLDTYMSSLKNATSIDDAMRIANQKSINNKNGPFNAEELRNTSTSLVTGLKEQGSKLGITSKLNDTLSKSQFKTFDQLIMGLQSKDFDTAKEAGEIFHNLKNEIEVAGKVSNDPIMGIRQSVTEINDNIRKIAESWIIKLTDTILLGVIAAATVGKLAAPAAGLWGLGKNAIGWLMRGGAPAATAAESIGGEALATGLMGTEAAEAAAVSGGLMSRILGPFSKILGPLGKIAGPLSLALGAFKGWGEAEEGGFSGVVGAGFGALTGGAKQGGGWLSSMLGVSEGGVVDKTLGVGESALWGAGAGAGIGALFGGVGAIPGAIIGAIVGGLAEIGKMLWGPIRDGLGWLAGKVGDFIKGAFGLIWKGISGFFGLIGKGISGFFGLVGKALSWIGTQLADILSPLGEAFKYIWQEVGNLFSGIGAIFAPIFTPFKEFFAGITDYLAPVKDTFSGLSGVFSGIGTALAPLGKFLAETVGFIATIGIGAPLMAVLKGSMVVLAQSIMFVVDAIKVVIELITGQWSAAWDTITNGISRIKNAFTDLFSQIWSAITNSIPEPIKSWLGFGEKTAAEPVPVTKTLNEKVDDAVKTARTEGTAQAHNDPANPKAEFWKSYHDQEKKMMDDLAKLSQEKQTKSTFATNAETAIKDALSMDKRMHEGRDIWSETINSVKEKSNTLGIPLTESTKGLLETLEGRSRKEFKETYVRGEMVKQGYFPGATYGGRQIGKEEYEKHVTSEAERLMKDEGFGADGKKLDEAAKSTVDLTEKALHPGSIYVHDIHSEKILDTMLAIMAGRGVPAGQIDEILAEAFEAQPSVGDAGYVDMGLFDKEQSVEAMSTAFTDGLSSIDAENTSPLDLTNKMLATVIDILSGKPRETREGERTGTIAGTLTGVPVGTDTMLQVAHNQYTAPATFDAVAQNMGLFDNEQASEAMTTGLSTLAIPGVTERESEYEKLSKILTSSDKMIGRSNPLNMGLFDNEQAGEAISEAYRSEEKKLHIANSEGVFGAYRTDENKRSVSNRSVSNNSVDSRLMSADEQRRSEIFKAYTSMQSMGIFDPNLGKDALDDADNTYYQQMMMGSAGFVPGHPALAGLGTPLGATAESERLREIIEKKKLTEKSKQLASLVNTGLFDDENIQESNVESINSISRLYGLNLNNLPDSPQGRPSSAALSKSLYYTDEQNAVVNVPSGNTELVKGDVNTNLLTMDDAEHYVARMIEGEKPAGPTALVPGIDALYEYMSQEAAEREEKIIRILEQIRDQRAPSAPALVEAGGSAAPAKSGLRNWSKASVRSTWTDMMHPSYSEQSNHTGKDF